MWLEADGSASVRYFRGGLRCQSDNIETGVKMPGNDICDTGCTATATAEACAHYCHTTHPDAALFYTYDDAAQTCWCKTSDSGREALSGWTSGRTCVAPQQSPRWWSCTCDNCVGLVGR